MLSLTARLALLVLIGVVSACVGSVGAGDMSNEPGEDTDPTTCSSGSCTDDSTDDDSDSDSGAPAGPAIVKNIVSDFSAVCDGVADDTPAFAAFNAWALQWQTSNSGLIELDIPQGSVCSFLSVSSTWTVGVKKLLVVGYGATLRAGAAGGFFLGGFGVQNNPHSARTATVRHGATSAALLSPSQASMFKVGGYVLMAGFDLMGWGYPPNPNVFQYEKVTAIDPVVGTISFDTPLEDDYLATWPFYWDGGGGADLGGPATLYALPDSWDTEVEYRGVTISQDGQTYANGRQVTCRDVTMTGSNCLVPTQNQLWQVYDSDLSDCYIEADKIVDTIIMSGVKLRGIVFQSSSIKDFYLEQSAVTSQIMGTPKRTHITDSQIAYMRPGVIGYGRTDEVSCANSEITQLDAGGGVGMSMTSAAPLTLSDGVITIPNSDGAQAWSVPGTKAFFTGAYFYFDPFTILDVTQDATNTYVHTTLGSSWPNNNLWYQGSSLVIRNLSTPMYTSTSCTGDPAVLDLNQAPPKAPIYSYSKRNYGGSDSGKPGNTVNNWGHLVSMKIDVTTPYTGTRASLPLHVVGQFGNFFINNDNSVSRVDPLVNLAIAGARVITPTAMTGAQSGDSLNNALELPWQSWDVTMSSSSIYFDDVTTEPTSVGPQFTIEIVTDQQFPSPAQDVDVSSPSAPANLMANVPSSSAIALSWQAAADNVGVTSYLVIRDGTVVMRTVSSSSTDTGLLQNHQYAYVIKAVDAAGNLSPPSNSVNATTQPAPGSDLPINHGLAAHWTFDTRDTTWTDATHGTMNDLAGNNNTGILSGMNSTSSQVTGRVGQALSFAASDSTNVDVSNNSFITLGGPITLSVWVNPASTADGQALFQRWGSANSYMILLSSGCKAGQLSAQFFLSGVDPYGTLCGEAAISLSTWHLVTATYDGTTQAIYVDGVLDTAQSAMGAIIDNAQDLFLGPNYSGLLDEARVYNRALSASEVLQLYQNP